MYVFTVSGRQTKVSPCTQNRFGVNTFAPRAATGALAPPLSLSLSLPLRLSLSHSERAAQAKWRNVFAFSQTRCINYRSSLYVSVCPLSLSLPACRPSPSLAHLPGAWGSVVKQHEHWSRAARSALPPLLSPARLTTRFRADMLSCILAYKNMARAKRGRDWDREREGASERGNGNEAVLPAHGNPFTSFGHFVMYYVSAAFAVSFCVYVIFYAARKGSTAETERERHVESVPENPC